MKKRKSTKIQTQIMNYNKVSDRMDIMPSVDCYEGALLWSAIGDALGWPTEFLGSRNRRQLPFDIPLKEYVQWKKLVGGRFWGYFDDILPGEYSDDTQLTLSVARCINNNGEFEPDRFAYSELPLWLHYERGGGRSVKTAARNILKVKSEWCSNFYINKNVDYRNAGANGAAMRNLPIILVNIEDEYRMVTDTFYNAIITHGHPRAILGAILFSYSIRYALSDNDIEKGMIEYLLESLETSWHIAKNDKTITKWIKQWDNQSRIKNGTFDIMFKETIGETYSYLTHIPYYLDKSENEYYSLIGAFNPSTKGSGIATVCSAIYLFIKNGGSPEEAIFTAVNLLGSDTDTIAVFLGSMLGARYGKKGIPNHLRGQLQDREYLEKTGKRLYSISENKFLDTSTYGGKVRKKESYLNMLAWELGLQEMFWDAIDLGGIVVHPALGRGIIKRKEIKPVQRENYEAKLLQVKFDCGQTCVFHSRVNKINGKLSESLASRIIPELKKASIDMPAKFNVRH